MGGGTNGASVRSAVSTPLREGRVGAFKEEEAPTGSSPKVKIRSNTDRVVSPTRRLQNNPDRLVFLVMVI